MMDKSLTGPIFVLGSMRSGTTLLRLVLDSHPDVAIGQETGFMRGFDAVKDIPGFQYGKHWFERMGITEAEMDKRLASFFDDLFSEGARRRGASRWGDKTPFHIWHARSMAAAFPDARFVAIVRHPVGVVRSLQRWRYTRDDMLDYWLSVTTQLVGLAGDLHDRLCLLRYEDLVMAPESVLPPLLSFLDLTWSPGVLRHQTAHHRDTSKVEGGTDPEEPIDASRAQGPLDSAPLDLLQAARHRVGTVAGGLGYWFEPPFVTELPAAKASGLPVVTGSQLTNELHTALPARGHPPLLALPSEAEFRNLLNELDLLRSRRSVRSAQAVRKLLRARRPRELVAAVRLLASSLRKQTVPRRGPVW